MNKIFKNHIQEYLKKHKITMKELHQRLGLWETALFAYISGRNRPTAEMHAKLASFLKIQPEKLGLEIAPDHRGKTEKRGGKVATKKSAGRKIKGAGSEAPVPVDLDNQKAVDGGVLAFIRHGGVPKKPAEAMVKQLQGIGTRNGTGWPYQFRVHQVAYALMGKNGWNMSEFGRAIGIAGNAVGAWMSGQSVPMPLHIAKMAEMAQVPIALLGVKIKKKGNKYLGVEQFKREGKTHPLVSVLYEQVVERKPPAKPKQLSLNPEAFSSEARLALEKLGLLSPVPKAPPGGEPTVQVSLSGIPASLMEKVSALAKQRKNGVDRIVEDALSSYIEKVEKVLAGIF